MKPTLPIAALAERHTALIAWVELWRDALEMRADVRRSLGLSAPARVPSRPRRTPRPRPSGSSSAPASVEAPPIVPPAPAVVSPAPQTPSRPALDQGDFTPRELLAAVRDGIDAATARGDVRFVLLPHPVSGTLSARPSAPPTTPGVEVERRGLYWYILWPDGETQVRP